MTEANGDYIRIIYDPSLDLRAWISLSDIKPAETVIFDELTDNGLQFGSEIEIFLLSGEREIFTAPDNSSSSSMITKKDFERKVFYPVSLKNGFIQIGRRYENENFDYNKADNTDCRICDGKPTDG